ncbi:transmembrane protein, putative [Rhizoctonia solani AG-3 Rhs1AP]|uniref:Transmembrane protein, putative n=1 Tax=Rhizoctonia solani AG-3 Rhs1AP TaxID=1086054 RepID=X8IVG3_9AGAM|nr:transmembrane protein, putative [Rhizoctonia solani AG-3 Rhs1AP]
MDLDIARRTLIGATTPSFVVLTTLLSYIALSLRPAFLPLVILLSVLINYARATIKRPEFTHRFLALLSALTMGTVFAYSASTKSALSTWVLSESLLLIVALVFSLLSLIPILVFAHFRSYVGSQYPLSGLLLFPVLWATTWSLVVHVSPIGRLGTWTPMTGIESYYWVLPIFGQPGLDYITGLWAIVLAEYAGGWLMGAEARRLVPDGASPNIDLLTSINHETEATDLDHQDDDRNIHRPNPTHFVLGLLLLGVVPSYFASSLPPPTHSNTTTELVVSCVHPAVTTPGTHPSFKDYLAETKTQASRAKIVLWPEGAARFYSDEEKKMAFKNVSDVANHQKAWIGVGYEQLFQDRHEYDGLQRVRGHNGLAIFGPGVQPVVYIKQKLVPLVETFSYEHSIVPPPHYPLNLPKPGNHPKSEKDWPRTIPLSAAICLDVSAPLATPVPVNNTELGRPALILAPARTWHPEIGKAMFQYASMRASEQGSSILWCDGGEGGVSGVGGLAAQGLGLAGGIGQVGTGGSWLQAIGIPFPYDAQDFTPTWYARWGDLSVIILGLALLGVGPVAPAVGLMGRLVSGVHRRLQATRRQENGQRETTPLLA